MRVTSLILVVGGTTIKTGTPHFQKLIVRSDLNLCKLSSIMNARE